VEAKVRENGENERAERGARERELVFPPVERGVGAISPAGGYRVDTSFR